MATGLDAPWSIVFLSDGTALVSERDSDRILELDEAGGAREVGVVGGVTGSGEGGLLGLAVDEDDSLYAYSTGADGNRIQRFDLDGEPGSLSLGEPETILGGIPSASYHDGGRIAFGPDGMLYATAGDAGGRSNAQDPESLAGKILRMTPDGAVPADNPFPDSFVYSLGHRNPQGIAWAEDGTFFATEFGQDTWDELNIIEPGKNYGWPEVEGITGGDEYTDPEQQWSPDDASPSGMAIIGDTLYLANLRGQVLRTVDASTPTDFADLVAGEYGRLRDAVAAPDGSLWILTNNTDGRGTPGEDDDRIVRIPLTPEE
jgi:glucose/arabinose dehydrogenase